jgi:hypothetical protein
MIRSRCCCGLAAVVVCLSCAHASAQVQFRKIVMTGDPATAAGAGVTVSELTGPVSINDSGKVAFRATLAGSVNAYSMWTTASNGSLQMLAVDGGAAPGGGVYNGLGGFGGPVINNSGEVAFQGLINSKMSIVAGFPGSMALMAKQGQSATKLTGGTRIVNGSFSDPRMNDSGQIVFNQGLPSCIELVTPGGSGMIELMTPGDAVPGIASATFGSGAYALINNNGTVAFQDTIAAPGNNNDTLWTYQIGQSNLNLLARKGDAAPGGGGTITRIDVTTDNDTQALNNAGDVSFTPGLYFGSATTLKQRIAPNMPAPGTTGILAGATFSIPINAAGNVVFEGTINDPNPARTGDYGVWTGKPDNLRLLAREQEQAVGWAPGIKYSVNGYVTINESGTVAMQGFVAGPGINGSNGAGVWMTDELGALRLVAKDGDLLDVDPGPGADLRTISGLTIQTSTMPGDGRAHSLAGDGELLMRLTFTDGSTGLFTATLVPEPGTAAMALAAILPMYGRRRRRQPGTMKR